MVSHSKGLGDVRSALLGSDAEVARNHLCKFVSQFGLSTEDVKNLTISALVMKLMARADGEQKGVLRSVLDTIKELGIGEKPAGEWVASRQVQ